MGIFGREKYSRTEYEKAKEKAETDLRIAEATGTLDMRIEAMRKIRDTVWGDVVKSEKRLNEIYGKGQAEAIALNEEYDRLLAQAQEAIKAVADFEREKLGMHKEDPGAPTEEADAEK